MKARSSERLNRMVREISTITTIYPTSVDRPPSAQISLQAIVSGDLPSILTCALRGTRQSPFGSTLQGCSGDPEGGRTKRHDPRRDASIQWAERIMRKIDATYRKIE
jgi:hypothetical protein